MAGVSLAPSVVTPETKLLIMQLLEQACLAGFKARVRLGLVVELCLRILVMLGSGRWDKLIPYLLRTRPTVTIQPASCHVQFRRFDLV